MKGNAASLRPADPLRLEPVEKSPDDPVTMLLREAETLRRREAKPEEARVAGLRALPRRPASDD